MAGGNDHPTTVMQRLLEDHFNTFYQRFESLESRVEEIHSYVRNLQQDSTEILSIVDDLQSSVDATRKTTRKTNNFVRRISQNLNGPNDLSRLSHHKKSPFGSGDSIQTHSASRESDTDDSGEVLPRRRSHRPYRPLVGRPSPNNHYPLQGDVSERPLQNQTTYRRYSPSSEPVKSKQNGISYDDKRELRNDLTVLGKMEHVGLNGQSVDFKPVRSAATYENQPFVNHQNTAAPQPSSGDLQGATTASQPQPSNGDQHGATTASRAQPSSGDLQGATAASRFQPSNGDPQGATTASRAQPSSGDQHGATAASQAQPSSGDPQGAMAATRPQVAVTYKSPESFLESINIQIKDHNLMSALGNVFKDFPSQPNFPTGLYTILLLDVSSSVNSTIFKQVETFVEQMVDDVENSAAEHNLEEMIAVLTVGGHCEVVQHFTNDYMPVKDALEKAHLGGKSPLLFGLIMAMAYCNKFAKRVKVNGHIINPRIIIFTDGYATESLDKNVCFGGDYEANAIRVQSDLFKFLPILEQTPVSVSCVGVGECNQVFLQDIAKMCHGRFYPLSNQNAPKLGRYYLYQDPVTRVKSAVRQPGYAQRDLADIVHEFTQKSHYSDTDKEEILELLRLDHIKCPRPVPQPMDTSPKHGSTTQKNSTPQHESQPSQTVSENFQPSSAPESRNIQPVISSNPPNPNIVLGESNIKPSQQPKNQITDKTEKKGLKLPPTPHISDDPNVLPSSPEVDRSDGELFDQYGQPCNRCHAWGTRVIRGEDWKWPDDQNSPGTVVAHKSEGVVVVKWDCGTHGAYPQDNLYKITEPRPLKHGEVIEVGCAVKRGPDWKRGDEDGGPSNVGTVIRKHRNNTVSVVWPIGIVDCYKFGEGEKEVEVANSAAHASPMPLRTDEPRESDTRQAMEGEVILWQWIDNETNELHTLSEEESGRVETVYQSKSGTVLVGYKGLQLRCLPTQMKYRDCGGKNRSGKLIRKVCNHEEADTYYCIETLSQQ